MIYQFVIPGDPNTKLRPRFAGKHAYTPAQNKTAEREIALIAKHLFTRAGEGPIAIAITFQFAIPASIKGDKKAAMVGQPCCKRPDLDNIEKLLCDALNEIAYDDDCQVWFVVKRKVWADKGACIVSLNDSTREMRKFLNSETATWF